MHRPCAVHNRPRALPGRRPPRPCWWRRWLVTHRQRTGARGETIAAGYLRHQGMAILATNWRCRAGEIDILARDGATLVVVEVKTRTSLRFGAPAEAVNAVKLQRLRRLAAQYASQSERRWPAVRIDVVAVLLMPGADPMVKHIPGVT